jgi:DNA-binding transcriptional regulator YiaG
MNKPTTHEILSARLAAGQNQTDAAAEIGMSLRAWQQWESGDRGMSPQLWSMYLLRTHQHPTEKISKKLTRHAQ